MSYSAIVCKLKLERHPNADKLLLGKTPTGYQVVVGTETQEGELGLFFPGDGQLSEEFAQANDLIARTDADGNRAGGYFGHNRRVREQNFRGQRSEGFWCPLSYLSYLPAASRILFKEGQLVSDIEGHPICNKYYTPQTLKAMTGKLPAKANKYFAKHIDTEQLKHFINQIPEGSVIYISEKLHGTSGRTGRVQKEQQRVKLWDRIRNRNLGTQYETLTGTRNTVLRQANSVGYHGSDAFRHNHSSSFQHLLNQGETVYYEIVGYANGKPIMNPHNTTKMQDKQLKKLYGECMEYSYGCSPVIHLSEPEDSRKPVSDIYVYRITQSNGDATVELSWHQMSARAKQLGLKMVPHFTHFVYYNPPFDIAKQVELYVNGSSTLDSSHIREGVVLRVESPDGKVSFYKEKSFVFKVLEGLLKENDELIDIEEIS